MANQGPQSQPRLLCLDFDDTIMNGHCHGTLDKLGFVPRNRANGISDQGVQVVQNGQFTNIVTGGVSSGVCQNAKGEVLDQARIQKILMGDHALKGVPGSVEGFKNGSSMRDVIREALQNGNKVAITSFTLYPEVLKPALAMIGLTAQEINQVCIVGGYPKDGPDSPEAKQEHIKAAMQHFGIRENANVMLVDDSPKNTGVARARGMQAQDVPKTHNPDREYFDAIEQFVGVKAPTLAPPQTTAPIVQRQPLAPQNLNVANQLQQQPYYQPEQVNNTHQKLQKESMITAVAASRPLTPQEIIKPKGPISQPVQANQFQKLPQPPQPTPAPQAQPQPVQPIQANQFQKLPQPPQPTPTQQAQPQPVQPVQANQFQKLPQPPQPTPTQQAQPQPVQPVQANQFQKLPQPPKPTPAPQAQPYPPIVKPSGPPPTPVGLQRNGPVQSQPAPQAQQLPPPPDPSKFSTVPPTTQLPPPPPPIVGLHNPPVQQPQVRIPEPMTPNQVAQHLPLPNPALDKILDRSFAEISKMYTDAKQNVHKNENVFVSLFNKAKSTANSFTGTTKEREQQIKQIVDVLKAIKNDKTTEPMEKAAIAFAYLDSVRNESNSSGIRGACLSLQRDITKLEDGAISKSLSRDSIEKAKYFANSSQTEVKNDKKLK